MHLFPGSYRVSTRNIRGVYYKVYSYYGGSQDIFCHLESLIRESFLQATVDEITEELSVDTDIAIEGDSPYTGC